MLNCGWARCPNRLAPAEDSWVDAKHSLNTSAIPRAGYVFAAGMPPANVGAALGSLRVMRDNPQLVNKLRQNAELFLQLSRDAGIDTGMAQGTAIIPIMTGHSMKALRLAEALFERGINAQPILYPAVPEKETRIRIFMTAAHTEQQIRDSVKILAEQWHRIQQSGEESTFRAAENEQAEFGPRRQNRFCNQTSSPKSSQRAG